jgi:hypothetical protein
MSGSSKLKQAPMHRRLTRSQSLRNKPLPYADSRTIERTPRQKRVNNSRERTDALVCEYFHRNLGIPLRVRFHGLTKEYTLKSDSSR